MWPLCFPGMCVCDKQTDREGEKRGRLIRSGYRCFINNTILLTGSLLSLCQPH